MFALNSSPRKLYAGDIFSFIVVDVIIGGDWGCEGGVSNSHKCVQRSAGLLPCFWLLRKLCASRNDATEAFRHLFLVRYAISISQLFSGYAMAKKPTASKMDAGYSAPTKDILV